MRIAIEGCCHGELDKIYGAMQRLEEKENIKIDLLICCGDFQAIRNEDDFECMSVPVKYREMGTFYKYYSGEVEAPYLTIFIGGNHEASNYLWELYYGGWVAPKIFYLGHSGVVRVGDLRIGGLSGIFKSGDYRRGFYERPPYRGGDVKSAYHVRDFDVFKLMQVKEHIDVFLTHDWPRGIHAFGDEKGLIRKKPHFQEEVQTNTLGSLPAERLLHALQPSYWFSAHLHVKFAALVGHASGSSTRFLALDKCLPRREYLQIVDLPDKRAGPLAYDEEWLAIVRATHGMMPVRNDGAALPEFRTPLRPADVAAHREFVSRRLSLRGASVPETFQPSTPPHNPAAPRRGVMPQGVFRNPQMLALMNLLELDYKLDAFTGPLPGPPPGPFGASLPPPSAAGRAAAAAATTSGAAEHNPEEVPLDDDDEGVYDEDEGGGVGGEEGGAAAAGGGAAGGGAGKNEEEIDLDDL